MKTIKFRAWSEGKTMFPNSKRLLMVKRDFGEVWNKGESIIWMQYTGLLDKNGKEIYEGDLVRWRGNKDVKVVKFGSYDNGGTYEDNVSGDAGFYLENIKDNTDISVNFEGEEVIGNIYENPELLTKPN